MKILILGSGMTGLGAAVHLCGKGHDITVLEKMERTGGLAATLRWKEHVLDYGAFVCYPEMKRLLPEEIIDAIKWHPVTSIRAQLFKDNRWEPWPMPPRTILKKLGVMKSIGAGLGILKNRIRFPSVKHAKNAEEFINRQIGKTLYRFSGLGEEIEKFTGKPANQLSRWFVTDHLYRFEEMSVKKSVKNMLAKGFRRFKKTGPPEPANNPAPLPEYPEGGIARIPETLTEYLVNRGVTIETGAEVREIHADQSNVKRVVYQKDKRKKSLEPGMVISTLPLPITGNLLHLENLSPEPALEPGKTPGYRNMLMLFLILNKTALTNSQLSYAFDPQIPFKRLVEFKHYYSGNSPAHQTGIVLEICYPADKEPLDKEPLDKETIYKKSIDSLSRMKLAEPDDIDDYCFRVSPFAYPVETLGYEGEREKLLEAVTRDNMISCGRQGLARYSQMSFAYAMGRDIAGSIDAGLLDKKHHLNLSNLYAYGKPISGV